MKIIELANLPSVHTTPLAAVNIDQKLHGSRVVVQLDDVQEGRFVLTFDPFQAMRVITYDCFSLPDELSIVPNRIMELHESNWISELKANLRRSDVTANFMDKARHFIVPLQDHFLEVVAWDIAASRL